MPQTENTLKISPLAKKLTVIPPQRKLALGMDFSKVQYLMQVVADENAPHFTPGEEPLADGRVYTATTKEKYYRPQLRVSQKETGALGPNVRFLKDSSGKVWLQLELEEVAGTGIPADAQPLEIRFRNVWLKWVVGGKPQKLKLPKPTLVTNSGRQGGEAHFLVRIGLELDSQQVERLYQALSTAACQARLELNCYYSYWLQEEPGATAVNFERVVFPFTVNHVARNNVATRIRTHNLNPVPTTATTNKSKPVVALPKYLPSLFLKKNLLKAAPQKIIANLKKRKENKNFKTVNLQRSLPFYFAPELEQNRGIYSGIKGNDYLSTAWTDTGFGLVCQATFPNTVYRLPDEIRLSYNGDLGTPHMIPALYRDDAAEIRVRVSLGAYPWHDPQKLVQLQDYLYRISAGALAAPQIIVGGYETALLRLTTAFPEEIQALGGNELQISLENGFELTLDLSLEYYRFLCELMAGKEGISPVGLTGEVVVTLQQPAVANAEAREELVRRVPVRLNLDDLASLPLNLKVDTQTISPEMVQITNEGAAEIGIQGCSARLLQYDPNSLVPIDIFEGENITAFPLQIAPQSTVAVELKPKELDSELFWNALQLELIGSEFLKTPKEVLDRIHEIAPAGALDWQITAECPLFMREVLPEAYQNLYRIEVQINRQGYTPKQIILGQGQAQGQVKMQRRLKEIISQGAEAITTFTYRVRNIYYDHQGAWGEEKRGEGSNVFVFPNASEND